MLKEPTSIWKVVNVKYGRQDKWSMNQNNVPCGDRRLNNQPLNISHPTIFRVASDPDSLVAQNREDGIRAPHFRRNMQDWELDKLIDLLSSRKSFNIPSSAR
ncbi:hypothetical protein H5410_055591 [Solanum commersonii]|uniref:Uncharacterized protein n=1 Tax=Solanum commersonii TaxID=4109 RepID=A0A9J5WI00_SOLCO|nr:hypothetical protein H5410_055591 [Solanum commersonii]